jgi:putative transposase
MGSHDELKNNSSLAPCIHDRNEAIARAYLSGQHTMAAIAAHFGVHYTTVSRLVKAYEKTGGG